MPYGAVFALRVGWVLCHGTGIPERSGTPQDIKYHFASASICGNNRVVFNVDGNKYRLVVEVQYRAGSSG